VQRVAEIEMRQPLQVTPELDVQCLIKPKSMAQGLQIGGLRGLAEHHLHRIAGIR